ncbi:MAG: hemolysin family protein [Propionibacteriaceae bacterium]|nr:hemolysin family protein [Propionibacteriaceae bacterium]
MTTAEWVLIGIAIACVVFAALGTAVEAAFASISKVRARELVEEGQRNAPRLAQMVQDPAPYLNTSSFVRIFLEVAAVVLVSLVVFTHFGWSWESFVIPMAAMGLVSFIVLGVGPRTIGKQHADGISLRLGGVLSGLTTVVGPIAQLFVIIGNALTPGKGFVDGPFASEAELRELVDMAEERDLIEDDERKMIHSVFELGDTVVKEVMVPRTEMICIEHGKSLRQGISLALRSGFSRIPVLGNNTDDVVGIFFIKDAMRATFDSPERLDADVVDALMRPPMFCPDSKPVDDLLKQMQLTRHHVAIVIDEFGGVAGLATIEDVLEEIVGEIVDEHDEELAPYTKLDDGSYRVSSRLGVDDLGELFDMDVDDEDVDTVLGLMAKELGKVPIPGASITWNGIKLTADPGVGRRRTIRSLVAEKLPEPEEAEDADE